MRFELLYRNNNPPLKYPSGEYILYSHSYFTFNPSDFVSVPLGLSVFLDESESFFVRTHPSLFENKQLSVQTYKIAEQNELFLVIYNLNPIIQPRNVFDSLKNPSLRDIKPGEPLAILTPVMVEKS